MTLNAMFEYELFLRTKGEWRPFAQENLNNVTAGSKNTGLGKTAVGENTVWTNHLMAKV